MIKVIGKNNCSRCDMIKNLLQQKHKEFDYESLEDSELKQEYLKLARENRIMEFPLIFIDNELKTIDQLVMILKGE